MRRAPYPRPYVVQALLASHRRMLGRPWGFLGFGLALALGLFGLVCGFGLALVPWFVCELLALHLRLAAGEGCEHHRGWFAAWSIEMAAWAFVVLGGMLGALGVGSWGSGGGLLWTAWFGVTVGLAVMLPWLFVPPLLLERGGGVMGALLYSVSWIVTGGVLRTFFFSLGVHLFQWLPLWGVALLRGASSSVPLWWWLGAGVLSALWFVPLGQGAVAEAYRMRSDEASREALREGEGIAGFPLTLSLALAFGVSLLSVLLVGGAVLARPAAMSVGPAGVGAVLGRVDVAAGGTEVLTVPESTLSVRVARRKLVIAAADGGGAGGVPLPFDGDIEELVVRRRGERIFLEVRSGTGWWHTVVDEAGVRADDDLGRRLLERLPPFRAVAFAFLLLLGSVSNARSLVPLAEALRYAALPGSLRPDAPSFSRRVDEARARAWRWVPWCWAQAVAVAWIAWRAWAG